MAMRGRLFTSRFQFLVFIWIWLLLPLVPVRVPVVCLPAGSSCTEFLWDYLSPLALALSGFNRGEGSWLLLAGLVPAYGTSLLIRRVMELRGSVWDVPCPRNSAGPQHLLSGAGSVCVGVLLWSVCMTEGGIPDFPGVSAGSFSAIPGGMGIPWVETGVLVQDVVAVSLLPIWGLQHVTGIPWSIGEAFPRDLTPHGRVLIGVVGAVEWYICTRLMMRLLAEWRSVASKPRRR